MGGPQRPSSTTHDRWSLQDNPGPDTGASVLWAPPSISPAVCVYEGSNCRQTPPALESRNSVGNRWQLLQPLGCWPHCSCPQATSSSGDTAWTPAGVGSHTTHRVEQTHASGSQRPCSANFGTQAPGRPCSQSGQHLQSAGDRRTHSTCVLQQPNDMRHIQVLCNAKSQLSLFCPQACQGPGRTVSPWEAELLFLTWQPSPGPAPPLPSTH